LVEFIINQPTLSLVVGVEGALVSMRIYEKERESERI
jgi:hypothetical protein